MIDRLRENKGVIVSDAMLSMLIVILFSAVIISLITNITLETKKIKINSQEMDYITEIFEYIETLDYDNVTEESIIQYINDKNYDSLSAGTNIATLTTPYKIGVNVEQYNLTTGNEGKHDLLKIITIAASYKLNEKDYTIESSRLRKRTTAEIENLINE